MMTALRTAQFGKSSLSRRCLFRHRYTTDHAASALHGILNVAAPVSTFDCDSFSSYIVYDTPSMY